VGSETLTGVPVLVRLSTAIDGFDYRDFASPSNGADLAFFDANEQALPYEIDEWHTNGESLVWVKLPTFRRGTRFTCAYGNNFKLSTLNSKLSRQHEVWREYAGVWHMNEDSGTAFDSTGHGLDALPSCGTNKLADISQMVAYENGACGRARVNARESLNQGNAMEVPSYDGLGLGGDFVLSGWYLAEEVVGYPRLISRKNDDQEMTGFEVLTHYNDPMLLSVRGSAYPTDGKDKFYVPDLTKGWTSIALAYRGAAVECYSNGVRSATATVSSVIDNGRSLFIGGGTYTASLSTSFNGQYDEIRLRGGLLSADRIKADYDMIANRAFCTYGAVKKGVK